MIGCKANGIIARRADTTSARILNHPQNNVDKRILLSAIQSWVCADMGVRKLLECECPKLKDITRAAETREKGSGSV